jgi:glycine/D-amino acid oxidase-like deaminating enzyme
MNVIVVGGGVIGCSAAWELAKAGARVTLIERSTGHFRNGITMAPIAAVVIAESMLGGVPSMNVGPFAPDRFVLDPKTRKGSTR